MVHYLIKLILSAAIIVAVSELAKRQPAWAGVLASLPLVSLLAIIWLYADSHSTEQVSALSMSIFWLVLPSLIFFLALPVLLRNGMSFTWSLTLAIVAMLAGYSLMLLGMKQIGMDIS